MTRRAGHSPRPYRCGECRWLAIVQIAAGHRPALPPVPTQLFDASPAVPWLGSGGRSVQSAPVILRILCPPPPAPSWGCETHSARGWPNPAIRRNARSSRRCASPAAPSRACSWSRCRRSGSSGCCWWPWSSPGPACRSAPPGRCGPGRYSGPVRTAGRCRRPHRPPPARPAARYRSGLGRFWGSRRWRRSPGRWNRCGGWRLQALRSRGWPGWCKGQFSLTAGLHRGPGAEAAGSVDSGSSAFAW